MDSFEADLDPVSLKIMNVFNRDDMPKLRKENQMLRNKLRQFRESDNKKTQDLKVSDFSLKKNQKVIQTKNDDLSALQKELSNTRHRYHDQKSERIEEIATLKGQLDEHKAEIDRLNKEIASDDRESRNYQLNLDINRKELTFLREELRDVKAKLCEAEDKNIEFDAYKEKLNILKTKKNLLTRV